MPPRNAHRLALLLVAAQFGLLAAFALRSYYFMDEFFFLAVAKEEGLTWDNLSGDVFGSFAPLFKLMFHPILALGVPYTAVALAIAASGALALWQLWRLLVVVGGATGRSLAVLALCGPCAVWIPSAIWPADGIHVFVAINLMLAAVEAHLKGRGRIAVICFAIALGLWAKVILLPAYMVALRALGLPERVTWRSEWKTWAGYGVVGVAFAAYVVLGDYSRNAPEPVDWARVGHVVAATGAVGFLPGLLSIGPLEPRLGLPALEPPLEQTPHWVPVLALLITAAAVAWTSLRASRARRAWLWLAVVFVLNAVFFAAGRDYIGTVIAREYRYYVDLVPLAGLAIGIALHASPRPFRARRRAGAVIVAALIVHAALAVAAAERILDSFPEETGRAYVAAFRADAARLRPGASVLGGNVPGAVMTPLYGRYASKRSWLAVLHDGLRVNVPDVDPLLVREDGRIVEARLVVEASARGPGCVRGPLQVRVALGRMLDSTDRFLRVRARERPRFELFTALTGPGGDVDALGDMRPLRFTGAVPEGLEDLRTATQFDGVRLDLDAGEAACITRVEIVRVEA